MAGSRTSRGKSNGRPSPAAKRNGKQESTVSVATHAADEDVLTPLGVADALSRTAAETWYQRDRRARLSQIGVAKWELSAAEALVDTCDLALAECVAEFEKKCGKVPVSEVLEVRQAASSLWLASREYLRRLSIAEKASRQLSQQPSAEKFNDLHLEYELEASALLALRQAADIYAKVRPQSR